MPKQTVLEMTQDLLSDMDSDEVNSINDTIEALQVAQIIQNTYYSIMDGGDWPHLRKLKQLEAATATYPTHMKLPEGVQTLEWVKYNKRNSTDTKDKYETVPYLFPEEFIELMNTRDSAASNVETISDIADGVAILVLNDTAPTYWTSFDDEYIVFDSYDNIVDSFLQNSKTQCSMYEEASFTISDTFIPDLPAKVFSYLIAESKSTAFNVLKQTANAKEEQKSQRHKRNLSQERWRTAGGIVYPNYGRK